MPVETHWKINLTVDDVITGQGADPVILRKRNPGLIQLAQSALDFGKPTILPALVYEIYAVASFDSDLIHLVGGKKISGMGITSVLKRASQLIVGLITLSDRLDQLARAQSETDLPMQMAMEGLATSALDQFLTIICHHFENQFLPESLYTSIPFSPGMTGWDTQSGQEQIFQLVDASLIGVQLNPAGMMIPRQTCSFIIGVSPTPFAHQKMCDTCSIQSTCQYRKRPTHEA